MLHPEKMQSIDDTFKNYLFQKSGVTEEQYAQLGSVLNFRTYKKDAILLREGEVCNSTFFVEKGLLRSFSINESGKEHIIQFAPENWFMSDRSSNYFNAPSDFFFDAIEDSEVVLIGPHFFKLASDISPQFRQYNDRLLHNHILHLQKRVNGFLSASAEKRYLDFIDLYPDLTLRVPQWMIASYLGITPESLSRVRKELASRNFRP